MCRRNRPHIVIRRDETLSRKGQNVRLLAAYGGQLAMYARALESATGRAVREKWIFLPVAAGAICITPPSE
jgi:hypothetical protein